MHEVRGLGEIIQNYSWLHEISPVIVKQSTCMTTGKRVPGLAVRRAWEGMHTFAAWILRTTAERKTAALAGCSTDSTVE
jgi:hypothetical protein